MTQQATWQSKTWTAAGRLGVALINATLILAVVLAILIFLILREANKLTGQVETLATNVSDRLEERLSIPNRPELQTNLTALQAKLEADGPTPLLTEVQTLNAQLSEFSTTVETSLSQCAVEVTDLLGSALGTFTEDLTGQFGNVLNGQNSGENLSN